MGPPAPTPCPGFDPHRAHVPVFTFPLPKWKKELKRPYSRRQVSMATSGILAARLHPSRVSVYLQVEF